MQYDARLPQSTPRHTPAATGAARSYDEEFEQALEESDGDVDYAGFAENHRFQVPESAHWNDWVVLT